MAFWIRAEDLVAAAVGPFETEAEAVEHVLFCVARGDAAEAVVMNSEPLDVALRLSPAEDRLPVPGVDGEPLL